MDELFRLLHHFRWLKTSALVGLPVWLLTFLVLPTRYEFPLLSQLLLLNIMIFFPLFLTIILQLQHHKDKQLNYLSQLLHPVGGLACVASFLFSQGAGAGILAIIWVSYSILIATIGIREAFLMYKENKLKKHNACFAIALVNNSVGAAFVFIFRVGAGSFGLSEAAVLLTAVHFQYSGFCLVTLTALCFHEINQQKATVDLQDPYPTVILLIFIGLIIGAPMLSTGIFLSPSLEIVSGFILALTQLAICIITYKVVLKLIPRKLARTCMLISSAMLAISAILSTFYAVGEYVNKLEPTIPALVVVHSWINSIGYVLFGLVCWLIHINEKTLPLTS